VTIRLGLQIASFSYGTGVEQLFPSVIAQAREAESAGFDELPGKLDALGKRCDEAGRDRSTLETSMLLVVTVDENVKPDQIPAKMRGRMLAGSPEFYCRTGAGQSARCRCRFVDHQPAGPRLHTRCYHDGR